MTDNTHAFISYAHQDTVIAVEIENQLTYLAERGKGKSFLDCFLDTKSIPPGKRYEPILKAALERADWLIVVFTGDQSVYCGFEIGLYGLLKPNDLPLEDKPVICLHDVDKSRLPAVLDGYSTTLVSQLVRFSPTEAIVSGEEVNLWWDSTVGRFLRLFCGSKDLYTANDRSDPSEFKVDIANAARQIAHSFDAARQGDEVSETPVQAGFEVTVLPPFDGGQARIPESSVLVGSSRAFDILGLNLPLSLDASVAPQITWGRMRQALSPPDLANIPWMDKLEINIVRAATLKAPEPEDVTFRGSRDGRIYRAILTRHKIYRNDMRRFYVLLVETFDRRFIGDRQTSMLLIALTLASRWRFTFFERWNETLRQFGTGRSDKEFQDACRQLEYNMDWMEHEGIELGADDMNAMVEAFSFENKARVQRFYSDWSEEKAKLKSQLPHTFEGLSPDKRSQVQATIIEFLTAIKQQNAEFLKLCIDKYRERILDPSIDAGG